MKYYLSILIITFWANICYSQDFVPADVEISTELTKYDNKTYYAHKVLDKQTLYSICLTYQVEQKEVLEINPLLKFGLKTGMIIRIPYKKIEESKNVAEQKIDKKKYKKYRIKWYETLRDVAKKFNVSVAAIMDLNDLSDPIVKKRTVLLIPNKDYIVQAPTTSEETPESDPKPNNDFYIGPESESTKDTTITTVIDIDSLNLMIQRSSFYERSYNNDIKISLVLPLNISDSTSAASVNMMDFYSGSLLAVNEFVDSYPNINITLNVVDLHQYTHTSELINSGILEGSKLIVGPINATHILEIADYAKNHRIPIVSPLDIKTKTLGEENPYFFLYPPSSKHNSKAILERIQPQDSTKLSLLFEKGTDSSDLVLSSMARLNERGLVYDTLSYSVIEGREVYARLVTVLDTLQNNKVLIASESEAFVSDAMRNLYFLHVTDTTKIEVYGQPRWKNFETNELEYNHIMGLNINSTYHIDYDSPLTKRFLQNFRGYFKVEPTPFAYQGYDIVRYFVNAIIKYDLEFPNHLEDCDIELIQSNINFVPISPEGGFENIGTKAIKYYKDWSVREIEENDLTTPTPLGSTYSLPL